MSAEQEHAEEALLEALRALVDDIEDHVDVEDGHSGPRPNWAMSLMQRHPGLAELISKAEGK